MPTAECRCRDCGHSFSHLTFKGDAISPVCPRCKGKNIEQQPEAGFMTEPGMGSRIAGVPKGPS